ncbi:MAG: 2-C-methyl-D-erythritol 4-phosphate cytidylyltransferase [Clostridiales bacterium]|nr:2-C-methyl-D-erythritol 4-phosphate cytidylyltransferase [Clostridiales bacterium]
MAGIIVAAGSGTRLGAQRNKVLLPLLGQPIFIHAVRALRAQCDELILVTRADEAAEFEGLLKAHHLVVDKMVPGGTERRFSVENALMEVQEDIDIVLVHDGARPLASPAMIERVIHAAAKSGAAVPAIPVRDTLRRQMDGVTETVSREGLYQVQTPQGFQAGLIRRAYQNSDESASDDAGLVERLGHPVLLVAGDARNLKITHQEDILMAQQLLNASIQMGMGIDAHRLVEGRDLVLGGVTIPHAKGLLGHSDADAALHALMDALLGACALGDIGQHFPDTDAQFKGANSLFLLRETRKIMAAQGFVPHQCDITILAQKPRLAPYLPQMRAHIAGALQLPLAQVSVKATTTEGLDAVGREEGIFAQAIALVYNLAESSI